MKKFKNSMITPSSQVTDPRQVTIESRELEKEPKRFTVRHEVDIPVQVPDSAGEGQLEASVLGPDQQTVPSTVTKEDDGYHIRFVPRQTGQHKVMVMYGGKEVSGSPYAIRIRDSTSTRVKVKEMEQMRTGYSTQKEVCKLYENNYRHSTYSTLFPRLVEISGTCLSC